MASSTPAALPGGIRSVGDAPTRRSRGTDVVLGVLQVLVLVVAVAIGRPIVAAAVVVPAVAAQLLLRRRVAEGHRRADELAAEVEAAEQGAAEQASVNRLLADLARRNQSLLERQIDLLVAMEDEETAPDGLGRLFQLDHLATRMRRNAESLLVLSGEEPSRRWGRAVAVTDVVRAAVAEVEDYRRVDVAVEESVALAGRAVADVAHLLAELIENGLRSSPPSSRLRVAGALRPDRALLLTVEDRGVGMAPEDVAASNELLADPPPFDVDRGHRLGFHVVARLARRYRLKVRLVPTPAGGVTAEVLVPEELLAPAEAFAPVGAGQTRHGGGR